MSSSPNSSSSSSFVAIQGDGPPPLKVDLLRDVRCPVSVVLGTGAITVRDVLQMGRHTVVRLNQSAGEDLQMFVNGVLVARGEVVVVEDSTAIRLTEIARRMPNGEAK
jgi:flagellar motor switch protein FliN/FliY